MRTPVRDAHMDSSAPDQTDLPAYHGLALIIVPPRSDATINGNQSFEIRNLMKPRVAPVCYHENMVQKVHPRDTCSTLELSLRAGRSPPMLRNAAPAPRRSQHTSFSAI